MTYCGRVVGLPCVQWCCWVDWTAWDSLRKSEDSDRPAAMRWDKTNVVDAAVPYQSARRSAYPNRLHPGIHPSTSCTVTLEGCVTTEFQTHPNVDISDSYEKTPCLNTSYSVASWFAALGSSAARCKHWEGSFDAGVSFYRGDSGTSAVQILAFHRMISRLAWKSVCHKPVAYLDTAGWSVAAFALIVLRRVVLDQGLFDSQHVAVASADCLFEIRRY